jgi:hypothetical protein
MKNRKDIGAERGTRSIMIFYAILAALALLVALFTPERADAWPGKESSCTSCHSGVDPDATIYTAIDGVAGTSVTVAAGGSFEVDFYFENATEAPTFGIGAQIIVPDLWTVSPGTSNSPAIGGPGWNGVWDAAAGVGWSALYDVNNQFAGADGSTINFGGSAWDTGTGGRGSRNSACDEGPSCSAGGTDLDGVAERMGADAIVNVAAGATGSYTVYVMAVGHDPGPGKTNVPVAITVTIGTGPNDPPTLTVTQPDGTGDTVVVGDPYNVTYDLADAEEIVTAAFYYDTDAAGLNGIAITGACAAAAEGTGATCSWDTTGMTPGTYYVYGIADDGVNPAVNDYSPGQLLRAMHIWLTMTLQTWKK